MANNWYENTTSGYESWFASEWSGSVQQDATCTYQVDSWVVDTSTYTWTASQDGIIPAWFSIERTIETLDSVTHDSPTVSYSIGFSVYSTSPTVAYDIDSSLGTISGGGELPYGSVTQDSAATYQLFSSITAERDFTDTYGITGYADNVSPSVYYDIIVSAAADSVVTYQLGGYVQEDAPEVVYDVRSSVEQDSEEVSYRVVGYVYQDSQENTYDINTIPWSAGRNEQVTYQVWQQVNSYSNLVYDILTDVTKDFTATYDVTGEVLLDKTVTYQVDSVVSQDGTVTYQLFGKYPVERNQLVAYNINALSYQVPNVIGLALGKAKKRLEQAGFQLGQITYQ